MESIGLLLALVLSLVFAGVFSAFVRREPQDQTLDASPRHCDGLIHRGKKQSRPPFELRAGNSILIARLTGIKTAVQLPMIRTSHGCWVHSMISTACSRTTHTTHLKN